MKSYALFQQYIWLVNTIHKYKRLTFDEINRYLLDSDMSDGVPIARSTFNRHRDAILDIPRGDTGACECLYLNEELIYGIKS